MKTRTKPSPYPPLPFYVVRAISFVSSLIVASILAYFCKQLWSDKYKIPWTFIIVFLAALLNLVALILTAIISCCARLSPIINILLNIPILILWLFGISMLTWNMYGALGHTCSITNWGNDRGVMVCQIYKALYSFIIFANMAHIAQLVLDVRARHTQIRRGKYDKMRDSQEIKIDDLTPVAPKTVHDTPVASETSLPQQFRDHQHGEEQYQQQHQQEQQQQQQQQYLHRQPSPQPSQSPYQDYREENSGWRPGQRKPLNHSQSYASSNSNYNGSVYSNSRSHRNDDQYYRPFESSSSMHLQDLSYQRPQYSNNYESQSYGSGYGHQQSGHYQGRY